MTRAQPRAATTKSAVLLGCAGALLGGCIGGQTGQEDSGELPIDCAIERTPIAADAATELGFTPAQVETTLAEPATSSLFWHRMGTRTELTLALLEVRARYVNTSTNGACADTLGLDVLVSIETADGLLDERLDAVIEADAADHANVVAEVAFDAVSGTLTSDLLELDLSNWRDPVLAFRLERGTAPALRGQITLDGGDPDPSDNQIPVSGAIAELPAP